MFRLSRRLAEGRSEGSSNGAKPLQKHYERVALFLASAARERRFRSVICTSCVRGEGTTTAVLHIAHELQARFGLRVLVVELNRQRPLLGRLLNFDPTPLDVAARGRGPANDYTQQQNPEEVALLPAASLPPLEYPEADAGQIADAVSSGSAPAQPLPQFDAALRQLLADAEKNFDMVLLDAPPILEESEALVAGGLVPRVILVVEAERTRREVLDRARRELARAGIEILGAILNRHRRVIPGWIYRRFFG